MSKMSTLINISLLLMTLNLQANSQNQEVCFSIPQGPAGPPGPMGLPSLSGECNCNDSDVREELKNQKIAITRLTKKINQLKKKDYKVPLINSTSTKTGFLIDGEEVINIFKQEWKKKNNCPVGMSDGEIPDASITASSTYNNDSNYSPYLARLNNRPSGINGSIGAWRANDMTPIVNLTCNDAFYPSSSGYSSYSNYYQGNIPFSSKLSTSLTQTVKCPRGCSQYTRVYGSTKYTDLSYICPAAIHFGVINNDGGIVTVERKPRQIFKGSLRNRIRSQGHTYKDGSFRFVTNSLLQWIQVDLQTQTLVTGVVTQGRPTTKKEWVQSFQVMYGNEEDNLMSISNSGLVTTFLGNTDMHSHVTNIFLEPVQTRFIRLVPITWHQAIALRFEVLTC